MAWRSNIVGLWDVVWGFIGPFLPSVLGAFIGQMSEPGLSLRQRVIQWIVGALVTHYAMMLIAHVLGWSGPIVTGMGFFCGLWAFRAVARVEEPIMAELEKLPGRITGMIPNWGRRRGPSSEGGSDDRAPE